MAAVHMATMTLAGRLAQVENIPQQDSAERAFNKLTRTFATQMEALKRYRTGGEQKVTVQHVSVSEGGQAIVGNGIRGSPGRSPVRLRELPVMACRQSPRHAMSTIGWMGASASSASRTCLMSAAHPDAAAELAPGQAEMFAHGPQERHLLRPIEFRRRVVDEEFHRHVAWPLTRPLGKHRRGTASHRGGARPASAWATAGATGASTTSPNLLRGTIAREHDRDDLRYLVDAQQRVVEEVVLIGAAVRGAALSMASIPAAQGQEPVLPTCPVNERVVWMAALSMRGRSSRRSGASCCPHRDGMRINSRRTQEFLASFGELEAAASATSSADRSPAVRLIGSISRSVAGAATAAGSLGCLRWNNEPGSEEVETS
jgi:hypothetical protein